eukprot:3865614-Rhodomonas_salina.3
MATEDFFLFAYGSLLWDESDISTAGLPPFQLVAAPFMKTVLALTLALGRGGSREEDTSSAERVTAPSLRIVFLVARNLLAVRCASGACAAGRLCTGQLRDLSTCSRCAMPGKDIAHGARGTKEVPGLCMGLKRIGRNDGGGSDGKEAGIATQG